MKLVDFLESHLDKARAWVGALNSDPTLRWSGGSRVDVTQIRAYVGELTSLVLLVDTRVTNHGFRNGRATPHQSVLQAGTAVLVDRVGVPRARCACGNPLVPPRHSARIRYIGIVWVGFIPRTPHYVLPDPHFCRDLHVGDLPTLGGPVAGGALGHLADELARVSIPCGHPGSDCAFFHDCPTPDPDCTVTDDCPPPVDGGCAHTLRGCPPPACNDPHRCPHNQPVPTCTDLGTCVSPPPAPPIDGGLPGSDIPGGGGRKSPPPPPPPATTSSTTPPCNPKYTRECSSSQPAPPPAPGDDNCRTSPSACQPGYQQ